MGGARRARGSCCRGTRERGDASRGCGRSGRSRYTSFRDGYLPYLGGEVKDVFEGLKEVRARPRLHPHTSRPPPGPPPGLRARLEHVSQPSHPRVRNPGSDGDLGSPNVFVPLEEAVVEEKLRIAPGALRESARRSTGSMTSSFAGSCDCAGWNRRAAYAKAFTCRKLALVP